MSESGEGSPKQKYEWKNVYVGRDPNTNIKRFDRRRVPVVDPSQPPEEPPPLDNEQTNEQKRGNPGNYNADKISKYLDEKADRDSAD